MGDFSETQLTPKGPNMKTTLENINDEILYCHYRPNPARPGYLDFDRNMTFGEFAKAIKDRLPAELAEQVEYMGKSYFANDKDELPSQSNTIQEAKLCALWTPGGSEGYYVEVFATTPSGNQSVWSAKSFCLGAAIAMQLIIQNWLLNSGLLQSRTIAGILENINLN